MDNSFLHYDLLDQLILILLVSSHELKNRATISIFLQQYQISQAVSIIVPSVRMLEIAQILAFINVGLERGDCVSQSLVKIKQQDLRNTIFMK